MELISIKIIHMSLFLLPIMGNMINCRFAYNAYKLCNNISSARLWDYICQTKARLRINPPRHVRKKCCCGHSFSESLHSCYWKQGEHMSNKAELHKCKTSINIALDVCFSIKARVAASNFKHKAEFLTEDSHISSHPPTSGASTVSLATPEAGGPI